MPIGVLTAMVEDFTEEELMDMGYTEEDIDAAWSCIIRSDMTQYYA